MFEFITISSGHAVIVHEATGHVFRFCPIDPGVWSKLTLNGVEAPFGAAEVGDDCKHVAVVFAETAATAAVVKAAEAVVPTALRSPLRDLLGWARRHWAQPRNVMRLRHAAS